MEETALRQTPGEMFDIMEFLQPGFLGDGDYDTRRKLFIELFVGKKSKGALLHHSNMFDDSVVKWFREWSDEYVFTARPDRLGKGKYFFDYFDKELLPISQQKQTIDSMRKVKLPAKIRRRYKKIDDKFERLIKKELERTDITEDVIENNIKTLQNKKSKQMQKLLRHNATDMGVVPESNPLVKEVVSIMQEPVNRAEKFIVHASDPNAAKLLESELVKKYGRGAVRRYGGYEQKTAEAYEYIFGKRATKKKLAEWTPTVDERKLIQKWIYNENPRVRVMIMNDGGSTGVNLQKASARTIHFDLPDNYALTAQRNGRNFRHGQKESVKAYYIATDTPEDLMRIKRIKETQQVHAILEDSDKVIDETTFRSLFISE